MLFMILCDFIQANATDLGALPMVVHPALRRRRHCFFAMFVRFYGDREWSLLCYEARGLPVQAIIWLTPPKQDNRLNHSQELYSQLCLA